ncbi:hypothetical protein QJQ45_012009 [Haematococcus lacustris]|nr:hypothetical protein QJQ45_012009 [Haematococcus lacustris]
MPDIIAHTEQLHGFCNYVLFGPGPCFDQQRQHEATNGSNSHLPHVGQQALQPDKAADGAPAYRLYRDGGLGVMRPIILRLGGGPVPGVCAGLQQGVRGMRVGGRRTFVVPPELGFSTSVNAPYATVPLGSSLQYEVELIRLSTRGPDDLTRQLAAAAGAAPGMRTPPSEQQGATAELYTSSTRKRGAGGRDRTQHVEEGSRGTVTTRLGAAVSTEELGDVSIAAMPRDDFEQWEQRQVAAGGGVAGRGAEVAAGREEGSKTFHSTALDGSALYDQGRMAGGGERVPEAAMGLKEMQAGGPLRGVFSMDTLHDVVTFLQRLNRPRARGLQQAEPGARHQEQLEGVGGGPAMVW